MEPFENKCAITEVGEATFDAEVIKATQPVLVAFLSSWSRPCQVLGPVLEQVVRCLSGKVKVVKVNADDNPELSLWYEVQSIPTLLYFVEGKLRGKVVGTVSKEAILTRIEQDAKRE